MKLVEREEILDYVTYGEQRQEILAQVLAQKKPRRIHLGDHLTFLFENRDTIRFQIQEMIRVEQIVKEEEIRHELDTYNELLGEAGELGATLLIEIDDPKERQELLRTWRRLPQHIYVELEDGTRVRARYDARQVGEDRLSSVQYLKFAVGGKAPVAIGTDHPALSRRVALTSEQRASLREDLGS